MQAIVECRDVRSGYGANEVVKGVSLSVGKGSICGLIGPNGAGKSTFLKSLYGLLSLRTGRVVLEGRNVTLLPAKDRLARGMAYVPQQRNVFPNLTVIENLEIAGSRLHDRDPTLCLADRLDYVFSLFPVLAERRSQEAGLMSGGEQRMVALGIGLITRPNVILLDEPTTGLAPVFVRSLMETIRGLSDRDGITAIVVEQNIASLMTIADNLAIMKEGKIMPQVLEPEKLLSRKVWEYL